MNDEIKAAMSRLLKQIGEPTENHMSGKGSHADRDMKLSQAVLNLANAKNALA